MFKWLQSFFKVFKRKAPVSVLSEVELIKAERQKRMPLFGVVFFDNGSHGLAMGPGMKLIKDTRIALEEGLACEIPESHPANID